MGVPNQFRVFLLLATWLSIVIAQDENNLGADDVARQSDLLAMKGVQGATEVELKNLQGKVDSIDKVLQNMQSKEDSIVKMLQDLSTGIDPLLSLPDICLSFQMEPKKIMQAELLSI